MLDFGLEWLAVCVNVTDKIIIDYRSQYKVRQLIAFLINCRMRNQSLLVIFFVVVAAIVCHALPPVHDDKVNEKENEIDLDDDKLFKPDPKIPKASDPRFNKMLPLPKLADVQLEAANKAEKVQKKPSTADKAVKDETSTIGNSANEQ